jgi:MFS family permease
MDAPHEQAPVSATYLQLLRLPGIARLTVGSLIGRLGNVMWQFVMVLFVLEQFHSPVLAGLTVFMGIAPGLLVSPIGGALLDRYGRSRLIALDYAVSAAGLIVIVALASTGHLGAPALLSLAGISAVTGILSIGGQRSLLPRMLPRHMWDRGNAFDSMGYTITAIAGPPLGGILVGALGGRAALLVTAALYTLAALVFYRLPDPSALGAITVSIWRAALDGLRYVLRNASLRGLAIGLFVVNLQNGLLIIAIPVLVLTRLHGSPAQVGYLWGIQGAASAIAALAFGRFNSDGKERWTMAVAAWFIAAAVSILLIANSYALVVIAAALTGLATGPFDIALFSLRQRRTEPAWFGRAFAVSASLNFSGVPVGSAIAGPIVHQSMGLTFVIGVIAALAAGVLVILLVPAKQGAAPET